MTELRIVEVAIAATISLGWWMWARYNKEYNEFDKLLYLFAQRISALESKGCRDVLSEKIESAAVPETKGVINDRGDFKPLEKFLGK